MLLSGETGLFLPLPTQDGFSLLDNTTLCRYKNMSNNMPGVMALQWHALNLFYTVSKL